MVNWRIRIHYTRMLIRGSGSGSGLTSNGSETLLFFLFRIWQYSNGRVVGKVDYKDNRGGAPHPPHFCKNYYSGPIGNRFMDLSETGLWTYGNRFVHGPIGHRFVDLSETGLWSYRKPVCGPIGNRFVDLLETGSWTYWKPVRGPVGNGLWT